MSRPTTMHIKKLHLLTSKTDNNKVYPITQKIKKNVK